MAPGSPDIIYDIAMDQPNWKILQIHTNSLFLSYIILKELQEKFSDTVRQAINIKYWKNLARQLTKMNMFFYLAPYYFHMSLRWIFEAL